MDPAKVAALRHEFGLDKPVMLQYLSWVIGLFHGNFGMSLYYQVPVSSLIDRAFPITLQIGITALIISILFGISVGVIATPNTQ